MRAFVLASVLGVKLLSCRAMELDCERAIRGANDGIAVMVCASEYRSTGDPATGAKLANVLRRSHDLAAAAALANRLIGSSAHAAAVQVLGKLALNEHRVDAGRALLSLARTLDIIEGEPRGRAVDEQALAGIFDDEKRYAEALRALDGCIAAAHDAGDGVVEGYCHMSAATVLGEVGYFDGAKDEFARAAPLLVSDRDLAWLLLKQAELDQRYGFGPVHLNHNAMAVRELKAAIVYATRAKQVEIVRSAELNLVYSLVETGHIDEAVRHLEAARLLDLDDVDAVDRALLEARIAYHRGNYTLASSINTGVYDRLSDDDDRLRVCVMQAQIGLATGDLETTIRWGTRGVEVAETVRGALSAIELRPWVLSMRRQPHELLFTALARAHRFDEALLAFDRWQGRTLLDAIAHARTPHSTLAAAAMHTEALRRLFPVLSDTPIMKPVDRAALRDALEGVDLVAVLVADEEIWRISSQHGQLDMVDVGALSALGGTLNDFIVAPTLPGPAEALGVKLLGEDAFRDTDATLFVLLDGAIANLPVAGLRAHGRPLIAMRPIVRASRLSELGCVAPVPAAEHFTILADAHGDLLQARLEAIVAAGLLGARPLLGAAATSAALFTGTANGSVHVATHAGITLGVGSLDLYDRPVSALEIAGRSAGSRFVFLAACGSGDARDGELATSLATSFLASGSAQVIATLRPVNDAGAAEVADAFYRAGGVADPARTLARVQAELAHTRNVDWPNFALFGHDLCRKDAPQQ